MRTNFTHFLRWEGPSKETKINCFTNRRGSRKEKKNPQPLKRQICMSYVLSATHIFWFMAFWTYCLWTPLVEIPRLADKVLFHFIMYTGWIGRTKRRRRFVRLKPSMWSFTGYPVNERSRNLSVSIRSFLKLQTWTFVRSRFNISINKSCFLSMFTVEPISLDYSFQYIKVFLNKLISQFYIYHFYMFACV